MSSFNVGMLENVSQQKHTCGLKGYKLFDLCTQVRLPEQRDREEITGAMGVNSLNVFYLATPRQHEIIADSLTVVDFE